MLANQKHESLFYNSNNLEKYLLNKCKTHKSFALKKVHREMQKQTDASIDYFLKRTSKRNNAKTGMNQFAENGLSYIDISIENLQLKKKNNQKIIKPKKTNTKINKSLLNLLLNHFHQQHHKVDLPNDGKLNLGQLFTRQTACDHRQKQEKKVNNIVRQKSVQHFRNSKDYVLKFESAHLNPNHQTKKYAMSRQKTHCRQFPEINQSDKSKEITISNIRYENECENIPCLPDESSKQNLRTLISQNLSRKKEQKGLVTTTIRNQFKLQRSSQKCTKIIQKQFTQADDRCSILNPWSTTMIKGDPEDITFV